MSPFEEDMALNAFSDVLFSSPVVNRLVQKASAQDLKMDVPTIREITIAERQGNQWNLRVQNLDAGQVETLARLWTEVGQEAYQTAYQHALQAEKLAGDFQGMQTCLEGMTVVAPLQPGCTGLFFQDVQEHLADIGQALASERIDSQGIITAMHLEAVEASSVSPAPIRYALGQLVLVGSLIGLLVGLLLVLSGLFRRWL